MKEQISKGTLAPRRKRNMIDFVEVTKDLIQNEGLESLSIRKIASEAGYNSATIYNYFDDLSHLTLFGSVCYLRDYVLSLSKKITRDMNSLEQFRTVYRCFNKEAFQYPDIFHNLFFGPHSESLGKVLETYYYELFPEELDGLPENMRQLLVAGTMVERDKVIVSEMVKDGFIDPKKADVTQELIIAAHQHFIFEAAKKGSSLNVKEHDRRFFVLFDYLLENAK
ncbi:MAG: TetR/AcrR family transcriptional regulator [Lachnospiraceae bacterium]|nr:TetR/AcrR family transcriptional regulator [Lachnospiraceae bacterium]